MTNPEGGITIEVKQVKGYGCKFTLHILRFENMLESDSYDVLQHLSDESKS